MSGDVVAEQHDDVGVQRIGALDDALDAIDRHPGIAGVKVGDGRDPELESLWPSWRREIVARNAKPHYGFAEPVSSGRDAKRAEPTGKFQEMTA